MVLNKILFPQYTVSNVIGVETLENVNYPKQKLKIKIVELLPNWPNITSNRKSQINRKLISDLRELIKK